MRRTFDALRNEFDSVVIDAPSVLPLADVWILSPFIDKALLVVRTGVTTKPAIHEAVAALDPTKLLGLVLNDAV
jgi:polysaccharide biosynthesis transport protein